MDVIELSERGTYGSFRGRIGSPLVPIVMVMRLGLTVDVETAMMVSMDVMLSFTHDKTEGDLEGSG